MRRAVALSVSLSQDLSLSLALSIPHSLSVSLCCVLSLSLSLCHCPRLPMRSVRTQRRDLCSISASRYLTRGPCMNAMVQPPSHAIHTTVLYIWDGNRRGILTGEIPDIGLSDWSALSESMIFHPPFFLFFDPFPHANLFVPQAHRQPHRRTCIVTPEQPRARHVQCI